MTNEEGSSAGLLDGWGVFRVRMRLGTVRERKERALQVGVRLGRVLLDSNCHVLAHMTHSLYLSPGLPGHTSLSLEHQIITHYYNITIFIL